ncbi:MAG: hypothetical protein EBS99_05200, partial [Betaproteobacteria bacterium]|nr:hypothetical protein [Betaproteobacteria bacterium]
MNTAATPRSAPAALPVLFVPHGSPMFALEPGAAGAAMSVMANRLAVPRAIVVISPHWEMTSYWPKSLFYHLIGCT